MTPLEKAAIAAFNADENRAGEYDHRSERVKDNYRAIARAVLLAIREPSEGAVAYAEGMSDFILPLEIGGNTVLARRAELRTAFMAMIDKALEEG